MENPVAWFRGEIRRENAEGRARQMKRQARQLEHPLRSGAIIAAGWASVEWLVTLRSTNPFVLATLAIFAAAVGLVYIWSIRRSQRKLAIKEGRAEAAQRP